MNRRAHTFQLTLISKLVDAFVSGMGARSVQIRQINAPAKGDQSKSNPD